jgi:hypothetical protein
MNPELHNQKAAAAAETTGVIERRRSAREMYPAPAWLSAEPGDRHGNQQVEVFDLSLHGIGFTAERPIPTASVRWIVIGSGGLQASARIRISSCRPRDDGGFDCGGEFF